MPQHFKKLSMPVTQLKFQQAIALHQQGKLSEAERLYADILQDDPAHFDAVHLLGVIALQTQRDQRCVDLITYAIGLNASMAEAHCNLGNAFRNLKRFDEALAAYERAIALKPHLADAHNSHGNALKDLKRFEAALASYQKAIALNPDYADAHSNCGTALHELKRFDEAIVHYQHAISLKPDFTEAYNNYGNTLKDLKRYDEALECYDRAIALNPVFAEAHANRASALHDLRRIEEALAGYEKAIRLKPTYEEAYVNRGLILNNLNRFSDALADFETAISLQPDFADAHHNRGHALSYLDRRTEARESYEKTLALTPDDVPYNRGIVLADLKRFDEALENYDKSILLNPAHAEAHNNRGIVLVCLKRFDEALESYNQAIALDTDNATFYNNKSFCLLLTGHFEQGWELLERRRTKPELVSLFKARNYSQPLWRGEDIAHKTVFIYWEQGLGDTIQFCRFAKLAEQRGANIIFSARNCLHALLKTLSPSIQLIGEKQTPAHFDYHCPIMSLPLGFGIKLHNIPADTPYLHADPARVQNWKQKLGDEGFKIGIVWQGNKGKVDAGRSFALREFEGISRLSGVRLISLQKGGGLEQLQNLPAGMNVESLGEDFDIGTDAFLDTAAVMENLDLIISSDTAIAHLAGALGRPVWVILKDNPDWRWMLDRSDSPWYPSMRLFRQKTTDDWTGIFADITAELGSLIPTR